MIFPKTSSHPPMAGEDQWKLSLALAVGLHALGFLLILFPPTFLFPRRDLTEVQTINLFDAGDLNQSASSGPKQAASSTAKKPAPPEPTKEEPPPETEPKQEEPPPPPEPPKPEPVPEPPKPEPPPVPEKVVPVEPPPKPIPTPPEKAISLEPKKLKKKVTAAPPPPEKAKPEKAKPEKPPEKPVAKTDDKIMKSLERIQARVNQKQENQALKDKLSRLRDSLHEIATAKPASTDSTGQATPGTGGANAGGASASGPGGGPSSTLDVALKKYYNAIAMKIHSNWALPDAQDWDNNLEAITFIMIQRDGTIVETIFDKKSGNIYFDQYVEKAILASQSMPPIPSDITEDKFPGEFEGGNLLIGLRFKPSGLY